MIVWADLDLLVVVWQFGKIGTKGQQWQRHVHWRLRVEFANDFEVKLLCVVVIEGASGVVSVTTCYRLTARLLRWATLSWRDYGTFALTTWPPVSRSGGAKLRSSFTLFQPNALQKVEWFCSFPCLCCSVFLHFWAICTSLVVCCILPLVVHS